MPAISGKSESSNARSSRRGRRALLKGLLLSAALSMVALSIFHNVASRRLCALRCSRTNELAAKVNESLSEARFQISALIRLPIVQRTAAGDLPSDNPLAVSALKTMKMILRGAIVYEMNLKGDVVACSPYGGEGEKTLTGKNYAFSPYFVKAAKGAKSVVLALDVTTNKRGVYFSAPIRKNGVIVGVLVIQKSVLDIDRFFGLYTDGKALLLSKDGVVFLSNIQSWLFKTAYPINEERRRTLRFSKQFADERLTPLPIHLDAAQVTYNSDIYDVTEAGVAVKGWKVVTLTPSGKDYPYGLAALMALMITL
ncbi:MAG: hypothetical protein GXP32_00445, partial [Kiritimatiellaeota bacterium]|nr:hypothetical protein [Kiritimatiellota bacterium]